MNCIRWIASLFMLGIWLPSAYAVGHIHLPRPLLMNRLHGTIDDYSHHHGGDRRIWSPALCEKRDVYVYLPPNYDPGRAYPVMFWLHGFLQDENDFLIHVIPILDKAIACGQLAPMIIVAPDGTIHGRPTVFSANSFFLNSNAGQFEDYIIQDIWSFVNAHYLIRPEREAHILAGISMGGFAAFNQAMKHQDIFKIAIGVFPPLNLRWMDCHCNYRADFDPCCWGWRTSVDRGHEPIGVFAGGLVTIRLKKLIDPLFGRGPETIARLIYENPIEMLDRLCINNGDLDMYIAYARRDQFNMDAQVESFLHVAREKGICVGVGFDPKGSHNIATAVRLMPGIIDWLAPIMAPYANCAN